MHKHIHTYIYIYIYGLYIHNTNKFCAIVIDSIYHWYKLYLDIYTNIVYSSIGIGYHPYTAVYIVYGIVASSLTPLHISLTNWMLPDWLARNSFSEVLPDGMECKVVTGLGRPGIPLGHFLSSMKPLRSLGDWFCPGHQPSWPSKTGKARRVIWHN